MIQFASAILLRPPSFPSRSRPSFLPSTSSCPTFSPSPPSFRRAPQPSWHIFGKLAESHLGAKTFPSVSTRAPLLTAIVCYLSPRPSLSRHLAVRFSGNFPFTALRGDAISILGADRMHLGAGAGRGAGEVTGGG